MLWAALSRFGCGYAAKLVMLSLVTVQRRQGVARAEKEGPPVMSTAAGRSQQMQASLTIARRPGCQRRVESQGTQCLPCGYAGDFTQIPFNSASRSSMINGTSNLYKLLALGALGPGVMPMSIAHENEDLN